MLPKSKLTGKSKTGKLAGRRKPTRLTNSYFNYLKSDIWKVKKAKYWATVGIKACQVCGSKKNLHVHHMDYSRFGGNEVMSDLLGVCFYCHSEIHKLHRRLGGDLRSATMRYKKSKQGKSFKAFRK